MSATAEPVATGRLSRAIARPRALGYLCATILVGATLEIVLAAANGKNALVPEQPKTAAWLKGFGPGLSYAVFLLTLIVFCIAYGVLVTLALRMSQRRLSQRGVIVVLVALHAILFLGPVIISTDLFSYLAYARMAALHGVNPYLHGPQSIAYDPIYPDVGIDWVHTTTAYGPLFTLISYPFGLLGVKAGIWGLKTVALLASAGTLWLTWRCAKARGFEPAAAALIVGANPLYLLYGFGGAHNDLIMIFLMMGAIALVVSEPVRPRNEALAGAAIVAGAMIKATAGTLLPFMLVARRRATVLIGAAAVAIVVGLAGLAAFGTHGIDVVSALSRDSKFVSTDSFANEFAHIIGKPGLYPVDHDILKAGLAVVLLYLLWRTWRGYDWIAASGWALLAIVVTTTWLLAWYIVWPLPLAVISRDRRLLAATLFVMGCFLVHQYSPLLEPVK
ncbi:MAG TPA: glycosyltransferase family 87 protein [Solirubrobacteraceae bacterium]|nr:glycosyltransferase family 87 protein [Solirubrobacteraceae bacterium]